MAVLTASPVRTLIAGAAAQVALFVGIDPVTGLGPPGWLTGIAYLVIGCAAITTGLRRYGATSFGPADLVTLAGPSSSAASRRSSRTSPSRSRSPAGHRSPRSRCRWTRSTAGSPGAPARSTPFGARFDMEVDAFLILVLSAYLADTLGPWVLAIGAMRYVFVVAAGRLCAGCARPCRTSMIRKTVAAAQGIVLAGRRLRAVLGETAPCSSWRWRWRRSPGRSATTSSWLFRHRADADSEPCPRPTPRPPTRPPARPGAGSSPAWPPRWPACSCCSRCSPPTRSASLTPSAFARIPLEALIGVGPRARAAHVARRVAASRPSAWCSALLLVIKLIDMGFNEVLARPFDPVFDWTFLGAGRGLPRRLRSAGSARSLAVIGVVPARSSALLVLMTLAVLRLTRLLVGRRTTATRTVAVLGVVWLVCAVLGVQFVPGRAGRLPQRRRSSSTTTAQGRARRPARPGGVRRRRPPVDPFRYTPGDELLTGLRGKDVVLAFVESYGRVAVEDPRVRAAGRRGARRRHRRLRRGRVHGRAAGSSPRRRSAAAAGSPTPRCSPGCGSTTSSGTTRSSSSDRLTLTSAFKRAGWRTVGVSPRSTQDWPEGEFFGYDQIYDARQPRLPRPERSPTPRCPTSTRCEHFQRTERAQADRAPGDGGDRPRLQPLAVGAAPRR